jgi:hypothetical protein
MAFDIETDGIEPLSARIRCISIGVPDKVVVLSFLSKDGVGRPYVQMLSHAEEREAIQILCEYFENEKEMKYGWNSITYDYEVRLELDHLRLGGAQSPMGLFRKQPPRRHLASPFRRV